MSSLPLANNLVPIKRALTTTSTAIFVPFTTQELFMEGDSLYYGLNAVSNNMIMADRKQLKNPNGLILGTPGSGKSFSAKREITNVFFTTTDDIIVADPEGEYYPLVEALGGQVIHISSTSKRTARSFVRSAAPRWEGANHSQKLLSFRYNIDTNRVEARFTDGSAVANRMPNCLRTFSTRYFTVGLTRRIECHRFFMATAENHCNVFCVTNWSSE